MQRESFHLDKLSFTIYSAETGWPSPFVGMPGDLFIQTQAKFVLYKRGMTNDELLAHFRPWQESWLMVPQGPDVNIKHPVNP